MVNADNTNETLEYSYDAWGNPREADDWSEPLAGSLFAQRGFTGHEHLVEFGLINMNGRVYDPAIALFLSPDNYVQDASQRALKYWRKRDSDYKDWYFTINPILRQSIKIKPNWMDYFNPSLMPIFRLFGIYYENLFFDGNRESSERNNGLIINMTDYESFFE